MEMFNEMQAQAYFSSRISGTGFLAFRDLKYFSKDLNRCCLENVLDLGCGSGRSTSFISKFCENVSGCDIDEKMIKQADVSDNIELFLTADSDLYYYGYPYTCIFSILMFFHLDSQVDLDSVIEKISFSLLTGGHFIAVIGNQNLYTRDYVTISGKGPTPTKTGDKGAVFLRNINCSVVDTFWKVEDIISVFESKGFQLMGIHTPTGNICDDNMIYKDEFLHPPYTYICFRKIDDIKL